ncbi:helix-turn-helix transcriptional regulator [Agrobacterium larrymoorei]|uniref:AraC family transcriptional regulator n=1 Tax=Agrobacterium larrymoorei TaxID=160699 RepID=A0AAF0KD33_9HYPH|nr:AraC family transcriptional regulator [Agrobacterium larrymoorei]WHA40498.1 AraC family transcriptional regulator [Agrobacterium larrymoorei]
MNVQSGEPSGVHATGVTLFPITQATAATFTDLFIGLTFICFICVGNKRVVCPINGEFVGEEGDLLIFPGGSIVTLENRPVSHMSYRATGIYFNHDLVDAIFAQQTLSHAASGVQIIRRASSATYDVVETTRQTLCDETLPFSVKRHRLMEPLVWLRENGVRLPPRGNDQPWNQVRRLIEKDICQPWRAEDVARYFAMSEATFRRWLAKSGPGFSQILLSTRLEKGLSMLQSTELSISTIALECGFKTPSHFSDAFRKRFGLKPRSIRKPEL